MTSYENLKRTLSNEEIQALIEQEERERKILRRIKIPTKHNYLKRNVNNVLDNNQSENPKYSPNSMWFYEDD